MRRTRIVARWIVLVVTMAALFTMAAAVLSPIPARAGAAVEGGCGPLTPLPLSAPDPVLATPVQRGPSEEVGEDGPPARARFPDEFGIWTGLASRGGTAPDSLVLAARQVTSTRSVGFVSTIPRQDRPVSDSVVRLYCGLLGHAPDPFELEYWTQRYRSGLTLATMAEAFATSGEFVARFGYREDAAVVPQLFDRVLQREPGPGGVDHWVDALSAGEVRLGDVIVSFTESPEFVAMTATMAPTPPAMPYPDAGSGRRIIYSNSEQRVWLIEESGELAKTHLVSGRRGVPRAGNYRVYSMSEDAWAPYDGITMHYMVRFARGEWPYGFHSLPVYPGGRPLQRPEQLGTHLSGGCVRQTWDDAEFVFNWADIGTPVIVLP